MTRTPEQEPKPGKKEPQVYEVGLVGESSKIIATAPGGFRIEINITREANKLNIIQTTERFLPTREQMKALERFREASRRFLRTSLKYEGTIELTPDGDSFTSEAVPSDLASMRYSQAYHEQALDLKDMNIPSWVVQGVINETRLTMPEGTHMGEVRPEVTEEIDKMKDTIDRIYGEGQYAKQGK